MEKNKCRVRITEALAHYTLKTGHRMTNKELAARAWPDKSDASRDTLLRRYDKGLIVRVNLAVLHRIAEACQVDANFLLSVEPMNKE